MPLGISLNSGISRRIATPCRYVPSLCLVQTTTCFPNSAERCPILIHTESALCSSAPHGTYGSPPRPSYKRSCCCTASHSQILSHQLLDPRCLPEEERDMMFWLGFHAGDRDLRFRCHLFRHPNQSAGASTTMKVFKLAHNVFSGPRFPFLPPEDQLDYLPGTRSNRTVSQTRQARSWQETEAFLISRKTSNPEVVRRKELTRKEED